MAIDFQKIFIINRRGQKLAVVVEKPEDPRGLVFVMHGQGGFKEQPQIRTFALAFLENDFTVVSFDAANTIGESEGNMEDASVTTYYEDLEDIIGWAKSQSWYQESFSLIGHSLGGMCITLYAENYPEKVKSLAPISTVVSGKLSVEVTPKEELEEWKRTGYKIEESNSKKGVMKKIKWANVEDRLKYDLLSLANKLMMPVILIVGEKDTGTPSEHQKILFNQLPGPKEMHVINGAHHTFREQEHLDEIKMILDRWIKSWK